MQEIAEPALVPYPAAGNLTDDVERRAGNEPMSIMLRRVTDDGWQPVTSAEFRSQVIAVAKGTRGSRRRPRRARRHHVRHAV